MPSLDTMKYFWARWATHLTLAFALLISSLPTQATAQDDLQPSYGGWGASIAYAAAIGGAIPFVSAAAGSLLTPENPDICNLRPEECQSTVGDWLAFSGIVVANAAAVWGIGAGAQWAAEELSFSRSLGWTLAGVGVGLTSGATLAMGTPRFEPSALYRGYQLTALAGMATLAGWGSQRIASKRGHAWPEFGLGNAGLLLGVGLGAAFCEGKSCERVPLWGFLGTVAGVTAAGLIWGYDNSTALDDDQQVQQNLLGSGAQMMSWSWIF